MDWSLDQQSEWYGAARSFNDLVNRMQKWYKLEPGTALSKYLIFYFSSSSSYCTNIRKLYIVFDNWRMLHGRSTFTGKRRMCGGYGIELRSRPLPFIWTGTDAYTHSQQR